MLDVFIRKASTIWALRETHALPEGAVIGFGVCSVEDGDGVAAGDAYWHYWCREEGIIVWRWRS